MPAYREGIKEVAAAAWGVVRGVKVNILELGPDHRKPRGRAHLLS